MFHRPATGLHCKGTGLQVEKECLFDTLYLPETSQGLKARGHHRYVSRREALKPHTMVKTLYNKDEQISMN